MFSLNFTSNLSEEKKILTFRARARVSCFSYKSKYKILFVELFNRGNGVHVKLELSYKIKSRKELFRTSEKLKQCGSSPIMFAWCYSFYENLLVYSELQFRLNKICQLSKCIFAFSNDLYFGMQTDNFYSIGDTTWEHSENFFSVFIKGKLKDWIAV